MLDIHGERVTAGRIREFLDGFPDHAEMLIMVGRLDDPANPGDAAALMAWIPDVGPSSGALNVPVFTQLPEFYYRHDAPHIER